MYLVGRVRACSHGGAYTPIWPHELPCYCYTNVVEVYKSTSEWVRASPGERRPTYLITYTNTH